MITRDRKVGDLTVPVSVVPVAQCPVYHPAGAPVQLAVDNARERHISRAV